MSRILIVSCHAPGHERATQALHATLAAASLDLAVTLLWLDDGLKQLSAEPDSAFSKMLQQLELFDEITLLRETSAGLQDIKTELPVKPLAAHELSALPSRHHAVMVY